MSNARIFGGIYLGTIALVFACSSTHDDLDFDAGMGSSSSSSGESSSSSASSSSSTSSSSGGSSSSSSASSASSSSTTSSSSSSSSASSSGLPCPMCPAYQDCDAGACWGCAQTNLDCTFKAPQTLGVACEMGYFPSMSDCSYQGNQPQFPYKPTYCCLPK